MKRVLTVTFSFLFFFLICYVVALGYHHFATPNVWITAVLFFLIAFLGINVGNEVGKRYMGSLYSRTLGLFRSFIEEGEPDKVKKFIDELCGPTQK
jgi:hypothetical protein